VGSSQEKMTVSEKSPVQQVEAAREAFEREFERFAHVEVWGTNRAG
jgi:hypothetical protein